MQEAAALEGAVARLQEENSRNANAVQQIRQREKLIKQVRVPRAGGAAALCVQEEAAAAAGTSAPGFQAVYARDSALGLDELGPRL